MVHKRSETHKKLFQAHSPYTDAQNHFGLLVTMAVRTKLIQGTVEFAGSGLQMQTLVTKTSILNKNSPPVDLVIHTFYLKL